MDAICGKELLIMYKLANKQEIVNQKSEIIKLINRLGEILNLDEFNFKNYNEELSKVKEVESACLEYKSMINANIRMT